MSTGQFHRHIKRYFIHGLDTFIYEPHHLLFVPLVQIVCFLLIIKKYDFIIQKKKHIYNYLHVI